MASIFETLNAIDISPKIKKKNGLDYLDWASAWTFVKTVYPQATYTVKEFQKIVPVASVKVEGKEGKEFETQFVPITCQYNTDGRTCYVETTVTITDGETTETITESLPVLDFKNQAVSAEKVTSAEVNKAIKRCLVKNLALFGLGLNLWQKEDMSDLAVEKIQNDKRTAIPLAEEIIELMQTKAEEGLSKDALFAWFASLYGTKNPRDISDIGKLEEAKNAVQNVSERDLKRFTPKPVKK